LAELKTSDFDYDLPPERIAQTPVEPRDSSRLLVLDRGSGELQHTQFDQIGEFLKAGDVIVVNQTRVIPARLYANKVPTGGKIEVLLLNRRTDQVWEALVGGKRLGAGKRLVLENGVEGEIIEEMDGARRLVQFEQPIDQFLEGIGNVPLPPYIHETLADPERYQTVYAQEPGSAAAPTAGLHFTPGLIEELEAAGVEFVKVTLHVGLDTFAPVTEEDASQHTIHTEWCQLTPEAAEKINTAQRNGGRVMAVGTTSVRVLESAAKSAKPGECVGAFEGATDIYILPGYSFKAVDVLVTNFHLPKSTLIMLVSAFAGRETVLAAYQKAVEMEYRFYSFGDAMLIL
jgi:S-adenosylmethionine:tRNA ribosyltransferase-isomerase